jgi:ubiquinone/menaquinone biosynthesis C-methylase UbiE
MAAVKTRARVADDFYARIEPRVHRRIVTKLKSMRRIVEIGCGDCTLARLLSKADGPREIIGVDISDGAFPKGRGAARGLRCVRADARALGFLGRGSVDAVVAVYSLHELDAPLATLREARSVLRPGGRMLIVDFPRGSLAQRRWNEDYYTAGQVRGMLKRAGFGRIRAKRMANRQLIWAQAFKPELRRRGR